MRLLSGQALSQAAVPLPDALTGRFRQLRKLIFLAGVLRAMTIFATGGFFLLLTDAALALPLTTRLVSPWLLLCLAFAVLLLRVLRQRQPVHLARMLERFYLDAGTTLTNAVELSRTRPDNPYTTALQQQALRDAASRCTTLATWPILAPELRRGGRCVLVAAAVWIATFVFFPAVCDAVLPRFLAPAADHPPFSFRRIALHVSPPEVIYGKGCEVRAVVTGGPCEKLSLFSRPLSSVGSLPADLSDPSGDSVTMFRRSDGTFTIALANLREPLLLWAGDGRARSLTTRISLRYTPQITRLELHATYPPYTRLPAGTVRLEEGVLRLPQGTRLKFTVHSNRPLHEGTLKLSRLAGGAETQSLQTIVNQEDAVTGEIELREATTYELFVTGTDGLVSATAMRGTVLIRPDEPPVIEVLEPGRDAVATPQTTVAFRVRAEDDYGVKSVLHFRGINGLPCRQREINGSTTYPERTVNTSGAFRFDELGVRPGDEVAYFFEAMDNAPGGAQIADSRLYRIRIIAQEEYDKILRSYAARRALFAEYYQISQTMRRLADRLQSLEKATPISGDAAASTTDKEAASRLKELTALRKELSALQEKINRNVQDPSFFDIESAFKRELIERQQDVAQTLQLLSETPTKQSDISQAAKQLARAAQKVQRNIELPARQIATVAQLLELAQRYATMARAQENFAQTAQRFLSENDTPTQDRRLIRREYADNERLLGERLYELTTKMEELLAALPHEKQYAKLERTSRIFLEKLSKLRIVPELTEAAEGFQRGTGKDGANLAARVAVKMLSLVSQCGGIKEDGGNCLAFNPSMPNGFGNTLQQILSALSGSGSGSGDGYSVFADDLALYGPQSHLAGAPEASNAGAGGNERTGGAHTTTARAPAPTLPPRSQQSGVPAIQLQREAKCPLIYRKLAGDYFRAVAEGTDENHPEPPIDAPASPVKETQ